MIRPARPDDLSALVELTIEHAAFERQPLPLEADRAARLNDALFGPKPRLAAWVATVEDTVVGYATYTKDFSTWHAREFAYLDCLYVRAPYRGLGLGKRLMHAIAKESGCKWIEWQTPDWNEDAARFYHSLGASESAKRRFVWPIVHEP